MEATQAAQIDAQVQRMMDLLRMEYGENLRQEEGRDTFTVSRPGGPELSCFLEDPFSDTSTGIDLCITVMIGWDHGEVPPLSSACWSRFNDFEERSVEPYEALEWDYESDSLHFDTSPLVIGRDYILMDATAEQVVERIRLLVDHGSSFTLDDPDAITEDHLAWRYGSDRVVAESETETIRLQTADGEVAAFWSPRWKQLFVPSIPLALAGGAVSGQEVACTLRAPLATAGFAFEDLDAEDGPEGRRWLLMVSIGCENLQHLDAMLHAAVSLVTSLAAPGSSAPLTRFLSHPASLA